MRQRWVLCRDSGIAMMVVSPGAWVFSYKGCPEVYGGGRLIEAFAIAPSSEKFCTPKSCGINGDRTVNAARGLSETVYLDHKGAIHKRVDRRSVIGYRETEPMYRNEAQRELLRSFGITSRPETFRVYASHGMACAWSTKPQLLVRWRGKSVRKLTLPSCPTTVFVKGGVVGAIGFVSGPSSAWAILANSSGERFIQNAQFPVIVGRERLAFGGFSGHTGENFAAMTTVRASSGKVIWTFKGEFLVGEIDSLGTALGVEELHKHMGNPFMLNRRGIRRVIGEAEEEVVSRRWTFYWDGFIQ